MKRNILIISFVALIGCVNYQSILKNEFTDEEYLVAIGNADSEQFAEYFRFCDDVGNSLLSSNILLPVHRSIESMNDNRGKETVMSDLSIVMTSDKEQAEIEKIEQLFEKKIKDNALSCFRIMLFREDSKIFIKVTDRKQEKGFPFELPTVHYRGMLGQQKLSRSDKVYISNLKTVCYHDIYIDKVKYILRSDFLRVCNKKRLDRNQ
jgi:hypothetical protein